MIDYPYSQQIHDKVLADWQNIPFDDLIFEGYFISNPSVSYRLWKGCAGLYPEGIIPSVYVDHGRSLLKKNIQRPTGEKKKTPNRTRHEKIPRIGIV